MKKQEKKITLPMSKSCSTFEYFEMLAVCTCAIMIVFALGLRLCVVDGDSMNQTLLDKDVVLTSDIFYEPKQGDIVVFHLTNEYYNKPLIKRVIATEGQWLELRRDGNGIIVTVYEEYDTNFENPKVYEDEHAYYSSLNTGWIGDYQFPVQVPEGCVFVMGDNRWNSSDSRSERVGFVDKRIIFGHVLVRVAPINKITPLTE